MALWRQKRRTTRNAWGPRQPAANLQQTACVGVGPWQPISSAAATERGQCGTYVHHPTAACQTASSAGGKYQIDEPPDKGAGKVVGVSLFWIARRNGTEPWASRTTYVCNAYAGRAYTSHGEYTLIRQHLNRGGVRHIASEASNRRMAAACAHAWSAGFLFRKAPRRRLHRWLLLAFVPKAFANA